MYYIFQRQGQFESYHEKSQPQSAPRFNAGPQCEFGIKQINHRWKMIINFTKPSSLFHVQ